MRTRLEDVDRLRTEKESLAAEVVDFVAARDSLRDTVSRLDAECRSAAGRVEELLTAMRAAGEEQARLVTSLDIATRLDAERWGVIQATAGLIRDDPTKGGLGGMLIQGLKIEEPCERAVVGFLGPWAYALIAEDEGAIKKAIEHLKGEELGQSLFLKYDEGEEKKADPAKIDGAKPARGMVSAPDFFEPALDVLLEGVYIARGLDKAFELAAKNPGLTFLTEDGDVVAGGTMYKGGSPEVGKVHTDMTASRRAAMEESLAECTATLDRLALDLESAKEEAGEPEAAMVETRAELAEAEDALTERAGRLAALTMKIEIISDDAETLSGPADTDALSECESRLVELEASLKDLEEKAAAAEEELLGRSAHVRDTASELAVQVRRLESCREARAKLDTMPKTGASDFPEEEVGRLEKLHERLFARADETRRSLRDELEQAPDAGTAAQIRAHREKISDLMKEHESLRELSHADELGRAELKVKVEQLVERIVDGHKVPLEFALKQYASEEPVEELDARVNALSAKMEHIGPVNPEALADHGALEDRYSFFREQMDDIERASSQLKRVITEIDQTIEQRFKETVEAVNGHFSEIFSTLFPGGVGEIRLTDPEDLLTSGIEIFVQPEGKHLRRISLLSGGETSLSALAFFFALFRVRPSPFYFLDEVEAALDDVNLHRFLDMVREFKKESQLILITHQKRSMEIADILYGVSMQEDGVSRVVSKRMAS